MEKYLKIFKALSDKTRMRIVKLLEHREYLCVCEIKHVIGFSMPTISNHLKVLKQAGLIKSFRKDKFVNYMISDINRDYLRLLISEIESKTIDEDRFKLNNTDRNSLIEKEKK